MKQKAPETPLKGRKEKAVETPEKEKEKDKSLAALVKSVVVGGSFGIKKGCTSSKGASRKRGPLDYPPKATGLRDVINLTMTEENGSLIASSIKMWEGRPLLGRMMDISTLKRVCFQVGPRNDPWYVLCDALDKEEYETLEDMLQVRGKDLLPKGPHEVPQAALYYRGLGNGYCQGTRFMAFKVGVICLWGGRSS